MIRNSFDLGPEGWHSYDYHGEIVTGAGIYVLATWQREGGVEGSGFIWADQSRWSTDVPGETDFDSGADSLPELGRVESHRSETERGVGISEGR